MTTVRELHRRTAEKLAEPSDPSKTLPCRRCAEQTPCGTLSDHGGLCYPCYQAYCREPFVQFPPSAYARKVQAENAKHRAPPTPEPDSWT